MNLQNLAMKNISTPSSSLESERPFGTAGNTYEAKWNRVIPENEERLVSAL